METEYIVRLFFFYETLLLCEQHDMIFYIKDIQVIYITQYQKEIQQYVGVVSSAGRRQPTLCPLQVPLAHSTLSLFFYQFWYYFLMRHSESDWKTKSLYISVDS